MTLEEEIDALDKAFGDLVRKSPKTPAEMEEKERLRILRMNALLRQSRPLTNEVLEAGIRVASVWDFVNTDEKYPEAIPVLIKHLNKPYHRAIKEGIVRALAVKEAKGIANKAILEEYHKAPSDNFHYRWTFGNTMRVIVTEDDLEELSKIVLDESNGDSRHMFVRALAKLKSPKTREILRLLVSDNSQMVADEARKALTRKRPAN